MIPKRPPLGATLTQGLYCISITQYEAYVLEHDDLFKGLQALAESAFPKKCSTCGRTFNTAVEFIQQTELIRPEISGLKQSIDDEGLAIVELFRNCPCGSTLMDAFNNRRDMSPQGEQRRKRFAELIDYLENHHQLDVDTARAELLKVMKGEKSNILSHIKPPS